MLVNTLRQPYEQMPEFDRIKEGLNKKNGIIRISGCLDSQKENLAAALVPENGSMLYIAENELKAAEVFEDMRLYFKDVMLYPAKDMIFYKAALIGNPVVRARMKVIRALISGERVLAVISSGGCLDTLLPLSVLRDFVIRVDMEKETGIEELSKKLIRAGYERVAQVEMPGQYAVRGGIIDVFDLTMDYPWRIELFGDEVDSIRAFDPESQRSFEELGEIDIFPATEEPDISDCGYSVSDRVSFAEYFPDETVFFLDEPARISASAEAIFKEYADAIKGRLEKKMAEPDEAYKVMLPETFFAKLEKRKTAALCMIESGSAHTVVFSESYSISSKTVVSYNNQLRMLTDDLKRWKKEGYRIVLLCPSRTRGARLAYDLNEEGIPAFFSESDARILEASEVMVLLGSSRRGFEYPLQKFVLITESDIFGQKQKKKRHKKHFEGKGLSSFSELSYGDYVVHEYRGLGIYRGIEQISRGGISKDYIKIEYAKGSSLYVQVSQLESIQKYGSCETNANLKLASLDSPEWNKTRTRVKKAVKDIAEDLIKIYSARKDAPGFKFSPDTVWQREFEEMFPYEETDDQLDIIETVKKDMESSAVMDRLVCGDVGYGKTEIALRAAFKAVQDDKQVVVLVPTTILAQQHYNTFRQRMADFPVNVEMLCRFRTPAQQKKIIEKLKQGQIDILIGTHRMLSKDVVFHDLGLLVVDEEQRFGVTHKEKIKKLKALVDVITLTATPIPRTLHMSLSGIRDMSILHEPPMNRMPIQTYVMEYDEEIVREAVSRELARGGQVYYVYNRVAGISEIASKLAMLLPEARVGFAHGKMSERELERIMYSFVNGETDVLVSTTIIETGLDISNCNTIIIHDADRMGLSQLYQLRGRVGRSSRTAYAFLMYRKNKIINEEAAKRLSAIREYTELGSGIKIAMRDLEIRGAGNLLGAEQSGHMEKIGYELYCKLLSEAVDEARGIRTAPDFETTLDIDVNAYIPESYIADEKQKLEIYKRIAMIKDADDMSAVCDELIDRFGDLPPSVEDLLEAAYLKAAAHLLYFTEIKQNGNRLTLTFYERARINTAGISQIIQIYENRLSFYPKEKPCFVYEMSSKNKKKPDVLIELDGFLKNCFKTIAEDQAK